MAALLNNTFVLTTLVIMIGLGGIGLLIFGLIRATRSSNKINQRLQVFVGNRDKTSPSKDVNYRFLPRELSGGFFNRTIKPFFQKIINFFGKTTPAKSIAKSNYDLRLAGNPYGMRAREYYGMRAILLFLGMGLAFLLYFRNGFSNSWLSLLSILIMILTFFIPRIWLNLKIRQRKDELSHNLPDALDMLSVCATAGLSFDQGLKKICEYWPTTLNEEFKQVLQEMEMGVSRAEALRNLKDRVNVDDLSSFIAIIIQAENIGMSYAEVLQSQAKQMRILRQFRSKEKANTLPAKMIVPVAIFIFPAILAIVFAPIVPVLMNVVLP